MTAGTRVTTRPSTGAKWWLHRWPTLLGLVLAAVSAGGGAEAAPILIAAGFVYLGAAALRRRQAAWPMFVASFLVIGAARFVPGVDAVWAMLAGAAVLAVAGLALGALRPAWGLPLQAAVMVAIGAIGLAAAVVTPAWAGLLVAGGLFAHAGLDWWHHRARRVVSRSLAEFCGVLDATLGVVVLIATFA